MAVDWPAHARRVISRLGLPGSFTHAGSGAVAVTGIYRRQYTDPLGVVVYRPTFEAMTADLTPSVAKGDALTVDGLDYLVRTPEHDPVRGTTILHLDRA